MRPVSYHDFCHTRFGVMGGAVGLDANHHTLPVAFVGFTGMNEGMQSWSVLEKTIADKWAPQINKPAHTAILDESSALRRK